jgi:hypothetical protein
VVSHIPIKDPDSMNKNTRDMIDAELIEALRQIQLATLSGGTPDDRFADVLDVIERTLHRIQAIEAHPSARSGPYAWLTDVEAS